jgi:hypothetical protein
MHHLLDITEKELAVDGDGKPMVFPEGISEIYDWFAVNGVNEWLPPQFRVTTTATTLTYTAFKWASDAARGFNKDMLGSPSEGYYEERTVPLLVPMGAEIRNQLAAHGHTLGETR